MQQHYPDLLLSTTVSVKMVFTNRVTNVSCVRRTITARTIKSLLVQITMLSCGYHDKEAQAEKHACVKAVFLDGHTLILVNNALKTSGVRWRTKCIFRPSLLVVKTSTPSRSDRPIEHFVCATLDTNYHQMVIV